MNQHLFDLASPEKLFISPYESALDSQIRRLSDKVKELEDLRRNSAYEAKEIGYDNSSFLHELEDSLADASLSLKECTKAKRLLACKQEDGDIYEQMDTIFRDMPKDAGIPQKSFPLFDNVRAYNSNENLDFRRDFQPPLKRKGDWIMIHQSLPTREETTERFQDKTVVSEVWDWKGRTVRVDRIVPKEGKNQKLDYKERATTVEPKPSTTMQSQEDTKESGQAVQTRSTEVVDKLVTSEESGPINPGEEKNTEVSNEEEKSTT